MVKGRVHSIETFGTVDGPGIRFILFMQGCPLRCKYCHNRDTWDVKAGTEYTTDEVITQASKYKSYMNASGGGITVSGGEATLQPEFLNELFVKAKESISCEIRIDEDCFKYFNPEKDKWIVNKGKYLIHVAKDSKNIIKTFEVNI